MESLMLGPGRLRCRDAAYHGRGRGRSRALLALALLLVPAAATAFDLQGHRGARGLAPENTLAAVAAALAVGVDTIELDLAVTADDRLVALHDLRLSPDITRGPDGAWIAAPGPAVRDLTLDQLRAFDVGRIDPQSRYARRFPEQRPVDGARIPTLAEVVGLIQRSGNARVRLSLETKLEPHAPELAPAPERFAELVVLELRRLGMAERTMVQSFDWRTLRAVQALAPEIPTACLTSEQPGLDNIARATPGPSPWTAGLDIDALGGSVPDLVKAAGCRVWSPNLADLHILSLAGARSLGLPVIVWTANDPTLMEALIDAGVDGIITDHPDRLRDLLLRKGLPVPAATPVPE
jgi:glycerophosphoryl diester phosphodiesterase